MSMCLKKGKLLKEKKRYTL